MMMEKSNINAERLNGKNIEIKFNSKSGKFLLPYIFLE